MTTMVVSSSWSCVAATSKSDGVPSLHEWKLDKRGEHWLIVQTEL
jgi:hypothetical protein